VLTELGDLKPVELREVWPREDAEFTPWLANNLGALGNTLGIELELKQVEAPVGPFSLDVLATEINSNRNVTIENQLETTNHDHLGKLLTYASGYDADIVVWIAKEMRDEHRQALDWLNHRTDSNTEFFGVVVEAFKIDYSRPAFRFDVVARPNQWRKTTVSSSGPNVSSGRGESYRRFFQDLTDVLREKHKFTNARKGYAQSWSSYSTGIQKVRLSASFAQGGRLRTSLYIDAGSQEENKQIFDGLQAQKLEIENAMGDELSWERNDHARSSRIALYREGSINDDPESLQAYQQWLIENLIKLKRAILPTLQDLVQQYGGDLGPGAEAEDETDA